jgi:hypothetical protein
VGGGSRRRGAPRRRWLPLRRTAVRASTDSSEESCQHQIEARVRRGGGLGGCWQSLGSGCALTREDFAGARSGSGRPELGKKTLPRPSDEWGVVLRRGGEVLGQWVARGLYL